MLMNVVEVVDIPPSATEDQARTLLNRPCEENRYMLVQVVTLPDGTQRAIYRILARALDMNPEERALLCRFSANRDGKDEAAIAVIKGNPKMSSRELEEQLKALGIKRSKDWCARKRRELVANGSVVTED